MSQRLQTLRMANSAPLWMFCALIVGLVLLQAGVFLLLSKRYAPQFEIESREIKRSLRAGLITAVGPVLSVFVVGLGLISSIGAPVTLLHATVAGNSAFEAASAQFGAAALGSDINADSFSTTAFTCAVWTMNLGCVAMMLMPLITTKPLSLLRDAAGNRARLGALIGISASLASFGYFGYDYSTKGASKLTAVLIGFFVMLGFGYAAKRYKRPALKEWGLTASLISAVLIAVLFF